ncbi:MAG: FtsX-like permease family protein [Mucilaginibacter polytrichastri]|nr:FtsX-like permease family protein [Mucilaginibacter polytrichastri]
MLKNNIKIAWRNLKNKPLYSLVILAGLTIGLSACMIIATVVIDDLSYDRSWSRSADLYRIISVNKMGDGLYDRSSSSFLGLPAELKKTFPEVEEYTTISTSDLHLKMRESDAGGTGVRMLAADTSVWRMLDIAVVQGAPQHFAKGNKNLVISERFKALWFPGENVIGKVVHDLPDFSGKPNAYVITGVMKDLPVNSHLRADVLLVQEPRAETFNGKFGTLSRQYMLMRTGTDIATFTRKVNRWVEKYTNQEKKYTYEFQPLRDVYLHSEFDQNIYGKGNVRTTYILAAVAALLLFLACINFINLSTARATTRLKETSVRKILGAGRGQLIAQFMSESVLFFLISGVLAIFIYSMALPRTEQFIGHELAHDFASPGRLSFFLFVTIALVSLFTGLYPAWILSAFKPADSLKGDHQKNPVFNQVVVRKILVVVQYSLSVIILLVLFVIRQQMHYMEKLDIGYNQNNLLNISGIFWGEKGRAFKQELLRHPGVEQASITSWTPSLGAGYMSREVDDPSRPRNKTTIWFMMGDIDFLKTLQVRLVHGRFLDKDHGADAMNDDSLQQKNWQEYEALQTSRPSVITASTQKQMQVNTLGAIAKTLNTLPVGVIRDFHNESLHEPLKPTVIVAGKEMNYGNMLIRIKPGAEKHTRAYISRLWKTFYPSNLLEINRVDDLLNAQYAAENKLQQFFTFFSGLSFFLAALGVFGLIVHTAQQRVKEIGIRKVLGASVGQIATLLSGDYIRLVALAFVIASPIAFFTMKNWLQDYAYRTEISWVLFAAAGVITLLATVFTISFQAIKAALANPVKSLRSE